MCASQHYIIVCQRIAAPIRCVCGRSSERLRPGPLQGKYVNHLPGKTQSEARNSSGIKYLSRMTVASPHSKRRTKQQCIYRVFTDDVLLLHTFASPLVKPTRGRQCVVALTLISKAAASYTVFSIMRHGQGHLFEVSVEHYNDHSDQQKNTIRRPRAIGRPRH